MPRRARPHGLHARRRLLLLAGLLGFGVGCDERALYVPPPPPTLPAGALGPGFRDVSGDLARLPPLAVPLSPGSLEPPNTSWGVFVDFDGDGVQEVVANGNSIHDLDQVRSEVFRYDATRGELVRDDRYALQPGLGFRAFLDLDGDGHVDALTGRAGREVAWGTGAGVFEPAGPLVADEGALGGSAPAWWPYDLDSDGWLDLLSFTHQQLRTFMSEGGRRFSARHDLIRRDVPTDNVSLLAYRDEADRLRLLNVGFSFDTRASFLFGETSTGADGFPRLGPLPVPAMPWSEIQADLSRFTPMGAAVGDADGDGTIDLLATLSPQLALWKGDGRGGFIDGSTSLPGHVTLSPDLGRPILGWGIVLLDFDGDGRPDLYVNRGDHYGPDYVVVAERLGEHRNELFLLRDDGPVAAGPIVGFDAPAHATALAIDDLEGDGDADLLNGHFVENPRLFRNDIETGNFLLSLHLVGTTSNRLGLGARVRVHADGREWLQVAGNQAPPDAWSRPLVFSGVGRSNSAESVSIDWPSGFRQVLADVPAGRSVTVEEPPTVLVSPALRRAPAATGTIELRVMPRDPAGTPREAVVALRVHAGTQVAIPTPERDGLAWVFRLRAPMAPGFTVVEATIDGVAVKVRPRLWWE